MSQKPTEGRFFSLCRRLLPILVVLLSACMDSLPSYRGPYLSWREAPMSTMTITYECLSDEHSLLKWGTSEDALTDEVVVHSGKRRDDMYFHFTITLTDLVPDTEYVYTVPGLMDEPARFRTAPAVRDADFSFFVYGDSAESDKQKDNEHYAVVAAMNRNDSPYPLGFVISSGDLTPMFADVYGWDLHFDAIRPLADHLPFFTPLGNHDWNRKDPGNTDVDGVWIHEFPQKADRNHTVSGFDNSSFAFAFGDAYFIFIGYNAVGAEKGSGFNEWLASELAFAYDNYAFTFVDLHVPPFDIRDDGYMDDLGTLRHQAPLFHKYRVTMVLSGHNHLFAHHDISQIPEGEAVPVEIPYIISGGGGQVLRKAHTGSWRNAHGLGYDGRTRFSQSTNHFLRIDVSGEKKTVRLTAFERSGEVLYGPIEKDSGR